MDFRTVPRSSNFIDNTAKWELLIQEMRQRPDLMIPARSPAVRARAELERKSLEIMRFNDLIQRQKNLSVQPMSFNPGVLGR